jgi:hypothetical protein
MCPHRLLWTKRLLLIPTHRTLSKDGTNPLPGQEEAVKETIGTVTVGSSSHRLLKSSFLCPILALISKQTHVVRIQTRRQPAQRFPLIGGLQKLSHQLRLQAQKGPMPQKADSESPHLRRNVRDMSWPPHVVSIFLHPLSKADITSLKQNKDDDSQTQRFPKFSP